MDGSTWIPWHLVASDPCDDFEPKPAPASPPVSADREGTDAEIRELAEAMIGIRKYATGDYFGNRAYAQAIERSEQALLLPGVVAARFGGARPAQWSHVWRCSGCGEMRPGRFDIAPSWNWDGKVWTHWCDASHCEPARDFGPAVEDPRDAEIRDLRALLWEVASDVRSALEQLNDPPGPVHCDGDHDVGHAAAILRSTSIALRAAGVEPTPGAAQEGKAKP